MLVADLISSQVKLKACTSTMCNSFACCTRSRRKEKLIPDANRNYTDTISLASFPRNLLILSQHNVSPPTVKLSHKDIVDSERIASSKAGEGGTERRGTVA